MVPSILVIIRENPLKSAKPVEGLRIALGLSTGGNPLRVILLGEAARLLATDTTEIQDGDILEQYLPSLQQLEIPLLLSEGIVSTLDLNPDFRFREASAAEISSLTASADRVLVF